MNDMLHDLILERDALRQENAELRDELLAIQQQDASAHPSMYAELERLRTLRDAVSYAMTQGLRQK